MKLKITCAYFLTGVFLITSLLGGGGCGDGAKFPSGLAAPAESVDQRLLDATSEFAFNLFHELQAADGGKNIFISPTSIAMALAMTCNGASGETREAIAGTLRLHGMDMDEINSAFADLGTILQNPDPKVSLTIANSLWAREGVPFNEDFLQRNRDYYAASVEELDFNDPAAVDTINAWVRENTGDRIQEIIDGPIDPLTWLFLINAIYFKGDWAEPFDPKMTVDAPFYLSGGSVKNHPMMFQSGDFRYYEGERFQAVSLPYGKNDRVEMLIFLPCRDSSLQQFFGELTPENWLLWLSSFHTMKGDIGLPRFTFEYETSLNDALKALGMAAAFDPDEANFSGMNPAPDLHIKDVKHKTFIELNEEGTEAAAVTSVEVGITSMPQTFSMTIDRPFFFAIVDRMTGAILFMGALEEPM